MSVSGAQVHVDTERWSRAAWPPCSGALVRGVETDSRAPGSAVCTGSLWRRRWPSGVLLPPASSGGAEVLWRAVLGGPPASWAHTGVGWGAVGPRAGCCHHPAGSLSTPAAASTSPVGGTRGLPSAQKGPHPGKACGGLKAPDASGPGSHPGPHLGPRLCVCPQVPGLTS